jgi:ketosteroid isomerase-like protein
MSGENAVMIVRSVLGAFARNDPKGYEKHFTNDIILVHRPSGNTLRGLDAVSASFANWRREFSEVSTEILDEFAFENRAVAQIRWSGRLGSKNIEIDFIACWVLSLREEKLCEIVDFYDKGTYQQQIDRAV